MKRIVSLLVLFGCAGGHWVDQVADTVPFVRITRIEAGTDATTIRFRYHASDQARRMGVHPPGHGGAFAIKSLDGTKTYRLTAIAGIATLPERTLVPAGDAFTFSLTFEPIPESTGTIHVGEGDYDPEIGESAWHFRNVNFR